MPTVRRWRTEYEPGPMVDCLSVMKAHKAGFDEVYSGVGDTPDEALNAALNAAADVGHWSTSLTNIQDMVAQEPAQAGLIVCRVFLAD